MGAIEHTLPGCGFCYVINCEGYLTEALRSIDSLRRVMPDARIAVVCPAALFRKHNAINHWVPLVNDRHGPIVKANAFLAPFERVAFVDTDTFFARDILDVFKILEAFDVALAHEPTRGWDYQVDAPPAFCELNTGFIVFRNNAKMHALFERWLREFDKMQAEQQLRNDQPSFRSALWKSPDIRLATLPSEYHCICGKPVSLAWEARLLHDRGDLPAIEKEINRKVGYRAYIPGFGQMRGYMGRKQWIRDYIKVSLNFFKVLAFSRYRPDNTTKTPIRWGLEDPQPPDKK